MRTRFSRTALSGPLAGAILRAYFRPPPGIEFKGTLLGKPMMVTTDASVTTLAQLRSHIGQFNACWFLRRIGELSRLFGKSSAVSVEGVAVTLHSLPYLALLSVEESSDDVPRVPDLVDVAEAARLFNGMREPDFTSDGRDSRVFEFMLRMGYSQLVGQSDRRGLIARTWMLYHDLWPEVGEAKGFDVVAAIQAETGLALRQLMMFGFAYSGHGEHGHMVPYSPESLEKLPKELGAGPAQQERFLRWVTATYSELRELGARSLPNERYDKYRLSPLVLKPVVKPDRPPEPGTENVRLVPVPAYLLRRVTDGLYHALATASDRGERTNPFRGAFGHVFQAYVGQLLHAGAGGANVLPEWEYGPKDRRRATPDWLVLNADRLLVIEVKQSALTLNTKMIAQLDMVSSDLQRTLVQGARQLLKFGRDVKARSRGLEKLRGVQHIELVLVTHDELPWANWVIRDKVAEVVPGATDIHFCSIDDLENLQRYCWGESPFDLLNKKRRSAHSRHRDFTEWLFELGDPPVGAHPLLAQKFDELITSWGATVPASQETGHAQSRRF